MLDKIESSVFSALTGQRLRMSWRDGATDLEVASVGDLPSNSPRPVKPFSLTLRSRERWNGPQGIYALDVPGVGTLELFVVPITPDAEGTNYEVIFN